MKMRQSTHLWAALVLASCCLHYAAAYPELFALGTSNDCFAQPNKAMGSHGAPVNDP